MKSLDKIVENTTRSIGTKTTRRSFIARLSAVMFGSALVPVLPIDRIGGRAFATDGNKTGNPGDPGDPSSCDYWRYCAVDGYLCSCCGGSVTSCPPGAEPSPITWVGTCRNPADGKDYIVSYNDCCGKHACGQCFCNRNESDEPMYRPFANNDLNWCTGAKSMIYHCTVSVIKGVASGS